MSLMQISAGSNVPEEVNVIIEIPTCGEPVKYEVDKESGTFFVDRFLNTAMYYPCNYGFIPQTLSEDGDPVDVLVLTPAPLICGATIKVRPIAMLKMTDEKGIDAKILAVPINKVSSLYSHIHSPQDVSPNLLATISHFFEHYKDLEPNKWVKVVGWVGAEEAKAEIVASVERYKQN